jgi:Cu/Zn superoxide dismutase
MIKCILALAIVGSMAMSTASAAPAAKGMKTETVVLRPMARSGVTGTALFTYNGKTTTVKLTVRHLKAMSQHPAHIHVGRCSSPGGILYPFQNIRAGRNGIGVASTSFAGPFAGKPWSINVHISPTNFAVIACGNVR